MFIKERSAHQLFSIHHAPSATSHKGSNNAIKSQTLSITETFKTIIAKYEKSRSHNINIMDVARKYNMQHRRIYDLFNLLTSLHVCKNVERGKISWISLNEAMKTLSYEYIKIECESLSKSLTELFDLSSSPSLGQIALKFLSLFIFLDVSSLPLKSVLTLFHNARCDIKSLERRVYLVLGMLEILGMLVHTKRTGDYTIVFDYKMIREKAMKKKFLLAQTQHPHCIEAMLSNCDEAYISSLSFGRQLVFNTL